MSRVLISLILSASVILSVSCSGAVNTTADNTAVAEPANTVSETNNAPGSAAEMLAEGNRLFDAGETLPAIGMWVKAAELDPNLAEAHFKLGVAYSLVEAEDESVAANTVNASTQDSKQKKNSQIAFENAVTAYKRAIETNPDDDVAHYHLGLTYNKLNEDTSAARSLREAVKLKTDNTEYRTELGSILIKLAKYREAVPELRKALELDPNNIKAEELLERAEAGKKRIDFVPPQKEDRKDSNSNTNSAEEIPASNKDPKPPETKPAKTPKTTQTPK